MVRASVLGDYYICRDFLQSLTDNGGQDIEQAAARGSGRPRGKTSSKRPPGAAAALEEQRPAVSGGAARSGAFPLAAPPRQLSAATSDGLTGTRSPPSTLSPIAGIG